MATQRFEHSTLAFLAQCSYRLSYRAVRIWLLLSDYYYQITIILDLIEVLIQNPTSSSWETVIRISDPDFNPDHAQLWTRSSYDHYLPTHQISSKSDQSFLRNPANKQTNKQTNRHTKVIAISRFSRDNIYRVYRF